MWVILPLLTLAAVDALKILQIVPGFTNSHVLFNYRLAETLKFLGHDVKMWTQMEMAMLDTGNNRLPAGVTEHRIAIHFKDKLKTEGLKVFQSLMFSAGDAYDLWWTGQEFKDMRVEACAQMLDHDPEVFAQFKAENFDLAIAHFHDLCPLAIAEKIGVKKVIWITHGTSIYDFAAVQLGLRTLPASVPHPLSSAGFTLSFWDRVFNLLWHLSLLDFVNLPQNLLHDENEYYRTIAGEGKPDLWELSKNVPALLINGERMLDFPRPLPIHITFSGELGVKKAAKKVEFDEELRSILDQPSKGLIVFSLGTVSNTTNMPRQMIDSFVRAFAKLNDYTILWRMEGKVEEAEPLKHLHLLKWLPQKDIMKLPQMKLLIAHGGYNSFLETAQAGVPAVLMPLFADQKINAMRAQRFGIARVLDKLRLTPEIVHDAVKDVLDNESYTTRAKKLSSMLTDKPIPRPYSMLNYILKLATSDTKDFSSGSTPVLTDIVARLSPYMKRIELHCRMKRVGVIGYGLLGQFLVAELNRLDTFKVVRIWNRTADEANDVLPLDKIVEEKMNDVDLVIEVAHPVIIREYAKVILNSCDLFIGSPTCLADAALLDSIRSIATTKGRRVLVPAGAFWGGNDIQKMADQGTLKALTITMTKHPSSFKLESPLKELNEAAKSETEKATVLYEGPVRSLCPLAPNNVNTMAGGAIAAHNLGFDGVTARLVSDPKMTDWHVVEVEAVGPDGFTVTTTRKNPAKPGAVTGQLTYYSFLASIKETIYKPAGVHIC